MVDLILLLLQARVVLRDSLLALDDSLLKSARRLKSLRLRLLHLRELGTRRLLLREVELCVLLRSLRGRVTLVPRAAPLGRRVGGSRGCARRHALLRLGSRLETRRERSIRRGLAAADDPLELGGLCAESLEVCLLLRVHRVGGAEVALRLREVGLRRGLREGTLLRVEKLVTRVRVAPGISAVLRREDRGCVRKRRAEGRAQLPVVRTARGEARPPVGILDGLRPMLVAAVEVPYALGSA